MRASGVNILCGLRGLLRRTSRDFLHDSIFMFHSGHDDSACTDDISEKCDDPPEA